MVIWPPGPLVEKDARTGTWQMLAPSRFWIVSIWRYFLAGGISYPPIVPLEELQRPAIT